VTVHVPRRLAAAFAAAIAALSLAGGAGAYGWPIKPFDKPHPVRGNFGDPRTVFLMGTLADGFNGPGSFSFHQGVDISAPAHTLVYPVVSGVVHLPAAGEVVVESPQRGLAFQYDHVDPLVNEGEVVTARRTPIGMVQPTAGHVHLTEIRGGHAVNPLERGHLAPYYDRTRPRVAGIVVRNAAGHVTGPLGVCGRISLAAEAYDTPSLPAPGNWRGLPVTPALVTWKVTKLEGATVVPTRIAADFRTTLPLNPDFWNVYARGTYQNAPRFGRQQYNAMPGRYIFWLDVGLDTRTLGNGVVTITVAASDTRGNTGVLSERISVLNFRTETGCLPEPQPPAPSKAP
jgi:murein DD-endopeptidase MepM/ murein hydrolase activator NlpD